MVNCLDEIKLLQSIPYVPCLTANYCQKTATSLNAMVEWMSTEAAASNRAAVPDILILLATSLYQPPEHRLGELLVRRHSPLHVFIVNVGSAAPANAHYAQAITFAATTAHLAVRDFETLDELVAPLCQSVQSFIGELFDSEFCPESIGF